MFKILNDMAPFFEDTLKELGVREYARWRKCAPATASTLLKSLAKEGLLTERAERNLLLYKAREESEAYKDLKVYASLRKIKESSLVTHLERELKHPLAIFLFGSYAKGENRKGSDIDMFVLTRTKTNVNLEEYQKKLKAPIQLFVHSPPEVEALRKKNPHLLNNMINGIRLFGFWEVF